MVSVIVPIFNIEDYLIRCLDSVLNQTYRDLEIILVDDGSTDSSGRICDEYAKRDARIRVIHKGNGGLSSARNAGLEQATGEYIFMPDGDDVLHPQMIGILYDLIKSGDYDFSMCYGEKVYDISAISKKCAEIKEVITKNIYSHNEIMGDLFSGGENHLWYAVVWNKLYRRSILEGFFFKKICPEDIEFNSRVFLRTRKAIITSCVLYYYIQRPNSILNQRVSLNHARWSEAWYCCLNNIPKEESSYRACVLSQLYRQIPLKRFWTRGAPYHQYAVNVGNSIIKATIKEFITNSYIPFFEKIQLLIYNVPIFYRFFVFFTEYIAKKKRS